jgi:hypothetical protein
LAAFDATGGSNTLLQPNATAIQKADNARYQSSSVISIATGRTIAESQAYYDSLPQTTKAEIEASYQAGSTVGAALVNAGVI